MAAISSVAGPCALVERVDRVGGRGCRDDTCLPGDGGKGLLAMADCGRMCPNATWSAGGNTHGSLSGGGGSMKCFPPSLAVGYGGLCAASTRGDVLESTARRGLGALHSHHPDFRMRCYSGACSRHSGCMGMISTSGQVKHAGRVLRGSKQSLAKGEGEGEKRVAMATSTSWPGAEWRPAAPRRGHCDRFGKEGFMGHIHRPYCSGSVQAWQWDVDQAWGSSLFHSSHAKLDEGMRMGQKAVCHRRRPRDVVKAFSMNALQEDEGGKVSERPFIPAGDHMLRCLSRDAELSVLVVVGTDIVDEAQRRHVLSPTATAALGRALMGTILLGAFKGDEETVQLSFKGDGPLGFMTTVGDTRGQAKGLVTHPSANPPLKENGKLDVGAAVGQGTLSVVRNHPTWKFPYRGSVLIQTGEIAEDITYYLAESEQTNSAIGLGVTVNRDGRVKAAAGFMVQVLPFAADETIARVEENIKGMSSVADMTGSGMNAADIIETLLQGIGVGEWSEQITPKYGPCGLEELKSRMKFAVKTLGQEDIQEAMNDEGGLEVKCEFCNEVVRFNEEDLGNVLDEMEEEEKERAEYAG